MKHPVKVSAGYFQNSNQQEPRSFQWITSSAGTLIEATQISDYLSSLFYFCRENDKTLYGRGYETRQILQRELDGSTKMIVDSQRCRYIININSVDAEK